MASFHLATDLLTAIYNGIKSKIFLGVYPVGSVYLSYNSTNPSTLFGGTWTRLKGGYIYGCVESSGTGNGTGTSTGSTTLSASQIPTFAFRTGHIDNGDGAFNGITNVSHTFDTTTGLGSYGWEAAKGSTQPRSHKYEFGGGQGHTHIIPYIAVFAWRRTA